MVAKAGGEDHLQTWTKLENTRQDFCPPHARHVHVEDHQVQGLARLQDPQGGQAAGGGGDPVPEQLQHGGHGLTDEVVIIHQEDPQGLLKGLGRRRSLGPVGKPGHARGREAQHHLRTLPLQAVQLKLSLVGLHGAVDHRQAQTRTLALGLGGEEGLHGLRHDLGEHALAGVPHPQGDPAIRIGRGEDVDDPAFRHGIHGVHAEVHEGVAEGPAVTPHRAQVFFQVHLEVDPLQHGVPQQVAHLPHQVVEVNGPLLLEVLPGEVEETLHHPPAPHAGADDGVEVLRLAGEGVSHLSQAGGQAQDGAQNIVHVVSHPAGEAPHALQLLGLVQLGLEALPLLLPLPALRDVLHDAHQRERGTSLVPQDLAPPLEPAQRTIGRAADGVFQIKPTATGEGCPHLGRHPAAQVRRHQLHPALQGPRMPGVSAKEAVQGGAALPAVLPNVPGEGADAAGILGLLQKLFALSKGLLCLAALGLLGQMIQGEGDVPGRFVQEGHLVSAKDTLLPGVDRQGPLHLARQADGEGCGGDEAAQRQRRLPGHHTRRFKDIVHHAGAALADGGPHGTPASRGFVRPDLHAAQQVILIAKAGGHSHPVGLRLFPTHPGHGEPPGLDHHPGDPGEQVLWGNGPGNGLAHLAHGRIEPSHPLDLPVPGHLLGGVPNEGDHPEAALVRHRTGAHLHREEAPIPALVDGLKAHGPRFLDLGELLGSQAPGLRCAKVQDIQPLQLHPSEPVLLCGLDIGLQDPTVSVQQQDDVVGLPHQPLEALEQAQLDADRVGLPVPEHQADAQCRTPHEGEQANGTAPGPVAQGAVDVSLVDLGHQDPGGALHGPNGGQHGLLAIVQAHQQVRVIALDRQGLGPRPSLIQRGPQAQGRSGTVPELIEVDHLVALPTDQQGLAGGAGARPGLEQGKEEPAGIHHQQQDPVGTAVALALREQGDPEAEVGIGLVRVLVEVHHLLISGLEGAGYLLPVQVLPGEGGAIRGPEEKLAPGIKQGRPGIVPPDLLDHPVQHLRFQACLLGPPQEPAEASLDQVAPGHAGGPIQSLPVPLGDLAGLELGDGCQTALGTLAGVEELLAEEQVAPQQDDHHRAQEQGQGAPGGGPGPEGLAAARHGSEEREGQDIPAGRPNQGGPQQEGSQAARQGHGRALGVVEAGGAHHMPDDGHGPQAQGTQGGPGRPLAQRPGGGARGPPKAEGEHSHQARQGRGQREGGIPAGGEQGRRMQHGRLACQAQPDGDHCQAPQDQRHPLTPGAGKGGGQRRSGQQQHHQGRWSRHGHRGGAQGPQGGLTQGMPSQAQQGEGPNQQAERGHTPPPSFRVCPGC